MSSSPFRKNAPRAAGSSADTISDPGRQSSPTLGAASHAVSDAERYETTSTPLHTTWAPTTFVMAKCDFCQFGGRGTLQRCDDCGIAICEECFDTGRLDRRHQLDVNNVNWNEHVRIGRRLKKKAPRARTTMTMAGTSATIMASPQPQYEGEAARAGTTTPSNSERSTPERSVEQRFDTTPPQSGRNRLIAASPGYQGGNGYLPAQSHSLLAVQQTNNNNYSWNHCFSDPPGYHQECLQMTTAYHGTALTSRENPQSWNYAFSQPSGPQEEEILSPYHDAETWNTTFTSTQYEHQYDQYSSVRNDLASPSGGGRYQPTQSSSGHNLDRSGHRRRRQGLTYNNSMPPSQTSPSRRQLRGPQNGSPISDASNYGVVAVAVASGVYPGTNGRAASVPRPFSRTRVSSSPSSPPSPSPHTLQHEPHGPPTHYEDYVRLHQANTALSQGDVPSNLTLRLPSIHLTYEEDEDASPEW